MSGVLPPPGWSSQDGPPRMVLCCFQAQVMPRLGCPHTGQEEGWHGARAQAGSLSAGRAWKCDHRTPRLDMGKGVCGSARVLAGAP